MTTSKLPAHPSLQSLRKQAKKLARSIVAGDAGAISRVRAHLPQAELPLSQRDAQLVLAHEYGHLSNRDTAGGRFALAVRRSLMIMAGHLALGRAATWYNPAWLFVKGFNRVFLLISQGATRLQEVLADRWAALSYGSRAFEEGLRHVVARAVRTSLVQKRPASQADTVEA